MARRFISSCVLTAAALSAAQAQPLPNGRINGIADAQNGALTAGVTASRELRVRDAGAAAGLAVVEDLLSRLGFTAGGDLRVAGVVTGSVDIGNLPAVQNVAGSVNIGNLPAVQNVAGSVAISNLPAVQSVAGSVAISNLPAVQSVAVTNLPAVQDVNIVGGAGGGASGPANRSPFGFSAGSFFNASNTQVLPEPALVSTVAFYSDNEIDVQLRNDDSGLTLMFRVRPGTPLIHTFQPPLLIDTFTRVCRGGGQCNSTYSLVGPD